MPQLARTIQAHPCEPAHQHEQTNQQPEAMPADERTTCNAQARKKEQGRDLFSSNRPACGQGKEVPITGRTSKAERRHSRRHPKRGRHQAPDRELEAGRGHGTGWRVCPGVLDAGWDRWGELLILGDNMA